MERSHQTRKGAFIIVFPFLLLLLIPLVLGYGPEVVQATDAVYQGNVKSRVFHQPGCRYYGCKNCTATFSSRDEAIQAGYRPCKVCAP